MKVFYHRLFIKVTTLLLLMILCTINYLYAQERLKYYFNKENNQYIQVSGSFQFWLRHSQLNPGSTVLGEERSELLDFSLRRYRLNFNGQATDKLRYSVVLGNNNINYYTYKTLGVKLLDAYIDYQINEHLGIGIGKNGWTGLSRYAAPSAGQPLAYDIDFVSIPMVVVYDDILRRFGMYARGNINKVDYRISLSRPTFTQELNHSPQVNRATFADIRPLYQFSSYIKYQYYEKESQLSPWAAGTYLGKKKILNLGAGMLYQPNTTWYLENNDTVYHPIKSFAIDLFYENPLPDNRAFTFYLAYFKHNLGKNFVRNIGINNPATGVLSGHSFNGSGNRAPVVGTGNILYFQLGYLLPVTKNNKTQFQPYGSFAYGELQALNNPMILYNTGFNYYLNGQKSKLSFGYENRPIFNNMEGLNNETDRKGLIVLQYQLQF